MENLTKAFEKEILKYLMTDYEEDGCGKEVTKEQAEKFIKDHKNEIKVLVESMYDEIVDDDEALENPDLEIVKDFIYNDLDNSDFLELMIEYKKSC